MLELRSANVEGGGRGESSHDGFGEQTRHHASLADTEEQEDDAATKRERRHRLDVVGQISCRVDVRQGASHHHRHQGKWTDVDVA